jgi:hypothetical protein
MWLKFSPFLILHKIEHFSKISPAIYHFCQEACFGQKRNGNPGIITQVMANHEFGIRHQSQHPKTIDKYLKRFSVTIYKLKTKMPSNW